MNKKAQGMSMNIIIIAALAVMVLLLVGSFMTGGFRALTGKITSFVASGPSAETTAEITGCDTKCTTWKAAGCPLSGSAYLQVRDGCNEGTEGNCEGRNDAGTLQTGTCSTTETNVADGAQMKITVGSCVCTVTKGGTSWGN